jgi:DNA-binding protein HU-beta
MRDSGGREWQAVASCSNLEGPLNRRELVLALAERTESDRRAADAALTAFVDIITETVAKGEPVGITGFAKFARVDRPARMGRNPQTGEAIRIKASRRVRITALKAFKDAAISGKVTKKVAVKKAAPVKKTAVKKAAPVKKTAVKKAAPVKKAPVKKATARR